jgi:hypothetical protein
LQHGHGGYAESQQKLAMKMPGARGKYLQRLFSWALSVVNREQSDSNPIYVIATSIHPVIQRNII